MALCFSLSIAQVAGFLSFGVWIFGLENDLLWRADLCIEVPLASTDKTPLALLSIVTAKTVYKHLPNVPWRTKLLLIRTTCLIHERIPLYIFEILLKGLQTHPPCLPWYLKNKGDCEGMYLYTDPLLPNLNTWIARCYTFNPDRHVHMWTCTHTCKTCIQIFKSWYLFYVS